MDCAICAGLGYLERRHPRHVSVTFGDQWDTRVYLDGEEAKWAFEADEDEDWVLTYLTNQKGSIYMCPSGLPHAHATMRIGHVEVEKVKVT